ALAELRETFGEAGEVIDGAGDSLGHSAEEGEGAEGDDEGADAEAGDERAIEEACEEADGECAGGGDPDRPVGVAPEFAEDDCGQAHERADGEVDPAGDDDGGECDGEEADFEALA